MSIERSKSRDFESLSNGSRSAGRGAEDIPSLRPSRAEDVGPGNNSDQAFSASYSQGLPRLGVDTGRQDARVPVEETGGLEVSPPVEETGGQDARAPVTGKERKKEKDSKLLANDRWLARNGHLLTYVCLYMFSIMVFFRPYEIVPGLQFLTGTAIIFAIATLILYIPSQLVAEGNLTMLSTEVKAILALTAIAILTIPLARDAALAWESFYEPFIKAVAMFIVMVNVVRTRKRLMGLMWLSLGIGIFLAVSALSLYVQGKFTIEKYRVAVQIGGMFENPNDMAIHFVMMTPIALALGVASKSLIWRLVYFGMTILFVAANMVTFSRGGFIGLIACCGVIAWKLGRKQRMNVTIISIIVGAIALVAAPGNYGLRMLSIFIPSLDPVGSSDQRQGLLLRSLQVTARNPWGIGIGNFPIVGIRNQQSHNAYTQVSAELGILGLIAYVVFIVSPLRKLGAIERTLFDRDDQNWFYYLAIGLQASIVGYMVSSFFVSVAYNWFIYYLIAYAVAFRRIYSIENGLTEEVKAGPLWTRTTVPST